jgi:hypothetical protein
MDIDRIIAKLKSFYPQGSIVICDDFRPEGRSTVFRNISLEVMKLEHEIESMAPLKIAVYIKYRMIGGSIRRYDVSKNKWYPWHKLEDTDADLIRHMFGKYKYIGVYFLKLYDGISKPILANLVSHVQK